MGVFSRMSTVVKAKMNTLLDRAEDPIEQLDYSYEKQLEMVRNVKRGLIEVTTSRRRLQLQAGKVQEKIPRLEEQARRALEAGREDLAVIALQRKQAALLEMEGLEGQIADIEVEEQRLTAASQKLQHKVDIFRGQKELTKARFSAAEAQARISEAFGGVSEEMADVGMITERAEQKTMKLQARAQAIDDLAESGVLDDMGTSMDSVDRELAQLTAGQNVENELAALRRSVGGGERRPQLESGS